MITFPLSRYRIESRVTFPILLPEYAGSTLRGVFGRTLRELTCVTRAKTCQNCTLTSSCLYTAIFEPSKPEAKTLIINTPPVPYIIEPPQWGERYYERGSLLQFHFTLIGYSEKHLAIILLTWQRALIRGIGTTNGKANLEAVYHCASNGEALVWNGGTILEHDRSFTLPDKPMSLPLSLEFSTPLRLQENGHALPPGRIEAKPFLMALVRRTSLLAEHYANGPQFTSTEFTQLAETAKKIEIKKDLRWQDWTRHSSRQKRTMQLGGVIGRITFYGDLDLFYTVLRLGEILHVGKEASFGLGQYQIIST